MKHLKLFISIILMTSMLLGCQNNPTVVEPKLRVALLVADQLGDSAFFDSSHKGLVKAREELGVEFQVFECFYDSTTYSTKMIEASEYADITFVLGFQFYEIVQEISQTYSDKSFVFVDGVIEGVDNLTSITFRQDEGSFLAGALAAMVTTDLTMKGVNADLKIGMVGGMDIPVIRDFQKGYEAGALYVNPEIEVITKFAGDFEDKKKCENAAELMYSQGVDIIFAVAGGAGQGVFDAAEKAERYAIGVDSDQRNLSPELIVASMLKNLDEAIYQTINYVINGQEIKGNTYYYGLKEKGVDLSFGDSTLPEILSKDHQEKIQQIKKELLEQKIKF